MIKTVMGLLKTKGKDNDDDGGNSSKALAKGNALKLLPPSPVSELLLIFLS